MLFRSSSGYPVADVLGQKAGFLRSGETPPETYVSLWSALRAGQAWEGEFYNLRRDGRVVVEFARISPVIQADGRTTHYLSVQEDITGRKQVEDELASYRDHLEQLVPGLRRRQVQLLEHFLVVEHHGDGGILGRQGVDLAQEGDEKSQATIDGVDTEDVEGYEPHQLVSEHRREFAGTRRLLLGPGLLLVVHQEQDADPHHDDNTGVEQDAGPKTAQVAAEIGEAPQRTEGDHCIHHPTPGLKETKQTPLLFAVAQPAYRSFSYNRKDRELHLERRSYF
mgnify:CR=1 FL=1